MEIEYTPRFLKDVKDIRDQRAKKETEKVLNAIKAASNFVELHKMLDIKKYEIGGYRIRYSNKPEFRIRFELLDHPQNKRDKIIKLQLCLPREAYEKYAHKRLDESVEKQLRILVTEAQFERLKKNF